jgi:phage gpG-like protein
MPADTATIDASDLAGLSRRYAGAERVLADEMGAAARWAAFAVVALAQRYVKRDTGNLANSLAGEVRSVAGGVEAVAGTSVPYAADVEYGRRPGGRMPPVEAIRAWAVSHRIPEEAAFAIARSIQRRGIPPSPYLTRALEELAPQIGERFAGVVPASLARLAAGGAA